VAAYVSHFVGKYDRDVVSKFVSSLYDTTDEPTLDAFHCTDSVAQTVFDCVYSYSASYYASYLTVTSTMLFLVLVLLYSYDTTDEPTLDRVPLHGLRRPNGIFIILKNYSNSASFLY